MNFDGIINTFTPLSDENCLKVLFALHEDEMTLEKLSQCSKTEIETAKSALRSLLEAGLVSLAEKQGEKAVEILRRLCLQGEAPQKLLAMLGTVCLFWLVSTVCFLKGVGG